MCYAELHAASISTLMRYSYEELRDTANLLANLIAVQLLRIAPGTPISAEPLAATDCR